MTESAERPDPVLLKHGWPDSYSDRELAILHEAVTGRVIWSATHLGSMSEMLKWSSMTAMVSSEMQRRAFVQAERDSRHAFRVAIAAIVIGAVVGVAQIAVAISG